MTESIVSQSLFDSIRRFNEEGQEYWSARELMPLLGYRIVAPGAPAWFVEKYHLSSTNEVLTAEDVGLLLLELAASISSLGYAPNLDAICLWDEAIQIYKGKPATAIFLAVHRQIIDSMIITEYSFYEYINACWQEIFSGYTSIDAPKTIAGVRPDYVLNGVVPVEVKADAAGADAIKQLARYMDAMSASAGILAAPSLSKGVKLIPGMTFVEIALEDVQGFYTSNHIPLKDRIRAGLADVLSASPDRIPR